jgi:hypothetical protein
LTVGGDLVLEGNDVVIQVDGCFFLSGDGEIVISLTEEQIKKLESEKGMEKILMKTGSTACPGSVDLGTVAVVVKPSKSSCKRVETERGSQSNQSTLALVLNVNASRCRVWWIVLISVFGAVILIVGIILMLVMLHPTACSQLKPHWLRKG